MKRRLEKFIATPELKLFYSELGAWLRKSNIKHNKLSIGFSVDIREIPEGKINEWLEISNFEIWKQKKKM
ncbi:hypothetical protein [Flavobacterium sp.]|uniref:hypothetical protein n=1 Tax=Flavobacterium sp. TaxID=239 RepID=UPI0038FC8777